MAKTRVVKYVSRPREVEVMKFDGTDESAMRICNWVTNNGQQARIITSTDGITSVRVTTDEFCSDLASGDYIVKRSPYEFEICVPEYFAEHYDKKE